MKKFLILFLSIGLAATLTACGSTNDTTGKPENKKEEKKEEKKEAKKESKKLPEITDKAKTETNELIRNYDQVKDTYISVNKDKAEIILTIQVNPSVDKKSAEDLADSFVRSLASNASIYGENDIKSPTKDSLGELYDYYDLKIGVGTDENNFILQGAKVKSSPKITW
ncbi:hypothetical protein NQS42_18480 [Bacillus sp. C10(2022)]|uniref:LptM family lipoprotein n=1 Tax=Bacillus sp. C10(2022) TaxID=2968454 RepID=UPI003307B600